MSAPRRTLNGAVTSLWSFLSPAYDLPFLQRWVYRPPHDEVIAQLRAHGARRIADVACGTGILSGRIERELQPDEIYGIDMSEGMLNQARAKSTRVQWKRAPAEQLPFQDGALDAVVSTSAFHFFDQPAALSEFHRVLAPGGLVAVATLSSRQPFQPPDRWMPQHNPSPAKMRKMFEDAGFTVSDQHRIRRPLWTQLISDLLTVGVKS
ncbi:MULTISPECIES: class I SAM-dependent methyltransferase [Mycobacterium]|uniref:Similarity with UbiE/COQ5 methyltransferase n=1 Tax=Mycobacterium kiyosense TaxID=2871094 RepID=A0A9P3Q6J7_9MYCO|nr:MULTISPECIES: class I SAM-dependent methyltransferase [Mycobacterium]BDB41802.1 similarity with UbiE/COQ5 methyltransferase [Mycobacterium kiyosense]BDE14905.1 similarity with UbiE/COQ5 methyltransferase [Mycobacterium sp. 20KCMC460]GLB82278.1 similarity with UbiE/COQ5 methyltransferase [Mycobacterium kiyosense]GLB89329.1 similarity with UbiE/COQ5 methyltransferase [Mycobacterium kiyosense]GLB95982.1 similarity with UbiE/COQ5 methyltransferase [Mycobacterium kiyosense]